MPIIYFPAPLAKRAGIAACNVECGSLDFCLKQVASQFPTIKPYIFSNNNLAPFTKIFINQIDSNSIQGLNTLINPNDEIQIIVAISGG